MGVKFTIVKRFGRCGDDKKEMKGVSSEKVRKALREVFPSKTTNQLKDIVLDLIKYRTRPFVMAYNNGSETGEVTISVDVEVAPAPDRSSDGVPA